MTKTYEKFLTSKLNHYQKEAGNKFKVKIRTKSFLNGEKSAVATVRA